MIWLILKTGHPCSRAWKMKRRPLRTRQMWKTPERSKTTLGVKGEQVRSPHPHSPFVNWCPQHWGPSALAVRPPSAWTPSHWSGTTQAMWGAPPLTRKTRRARTTVPCQVWTQAAKFLAPEPHAQLLVVRVQRVVDQTSCGFLCLSCPPLTYLRAGPFLLLME